MDDVSSVCVAGRFCCAIRVENKPRISSGDRSELIRKSMARAAGVTRDTLCKALRKDGDPAAEHPSGRGESAGTEDPCRITVTDIDGTLGRTMRLRKLGRNSTGKTGIPKM